MQLIDRAWKRLENAGALAATKRPRSTDAQGSKPLRDRNQGLDARQVAATFLCPSRSARRYGLYGRFLSSCLCSGRWRPGLALGVGLVFILLVAVARGGTTGLRRQDSKTDAIGKADWSELLPEGEGKAQVAAACSGCHELSQVIAQAKSKTRWTATVKKMISVNQAPIDDADIPALVAYLSKSFGEDNPIDELPMNINKCRVEALSRLPGIGPDLAKAIAESRKDGGSFSSSGDLLRVKGIDKAKLEKIKPFIATDR